MSFVVSTEGGMDIEKVAHDTPEKIVSLLVDPATGIMPHHGRTVAEALGLSGELAKQAGKLAEQLYAAFVAKDMELLEINPLIVTKDNQLRCLDAKISFDNNAHVPASRHRRACATKPRKTPRRSRRRNTISPTSRSTARSAAW